jgi:hypothetical protein
MWSKFLLAEALFLLGWQRRSVPLLSTKINSFVRSYPSLPAEIRVHRGLDDEANGNNLRHQVAKRGGSSTFKIMTTGVVDIFGARCRQL